MTADVAVDLDHAWPPASGQGALAGLTAPFRFWFSERFDTPTLIQRLAWAPVAAGKNVFISGPTGGGKSLAAFVPILEKLLATPFAPAVRCLYIAPLKALVNDAARNLRQNLTELASRLTPGLPRLRVEMRTGDATQAARKRLRTQPPDILLTTPESLAVLLTEAAARKALANVRHVIVDEVHALAASKRGADLSLSLERLTAMAGHAIQRIGLSATCSPLSEAARFLVGVGRPCTIAHAPEPGRLELRIEPLPPGAGFWRSLLDRLESEIARNRTTLIFTNVRSTAERLTWLLWRRFPAWVDAIGIHHASIARDRRSEIEQRLKEGALRVVVSSATLELGIDIGSIDGVVLVHPPGCVVRLLQRVGRGNHSPEGVRRGLVLTASPTELMEAAVTAASGRAGEYERLLCPEHPLDVLCQQLVGMATERAWSGDEAYALARRAHPYRDLPRGDFDGCLNYLTGVRHDGTRWLPPRLARVGTEWRLLDERTARILRCNIGTIINEDATKVRLHDGNAVGEVDEGFADRLKCSSTGATSVGQSSSMRLSACRWCRAGAVMAGFYRRSLPDACMPCVSGRQRPCAKDRALSERFSSASMICRKLAARCSCTFSKSRNTSVKSRT
jgi:ATP-dependent helicase Lhr and Lhr-like helicase